MIKAKSIEELVCLHAIAQKKLDKMVEENRPLPEVVFEQFRHYKVASSDGKKFYSVQLGAYRNSEGNPVFWVACNCFGSLHKEACYHSLTALKEHLKEVERREQVKVKPNIHDASDKPYLKGGSDKSPETFGKIRI